MSKVIGGMLLGFGIALIVVALVIIINSQTNPETKNVPCYDRNNNLITNQICIENISNDNIQSLVAIGLLCMLFGEALICIDDIK